MMMTGVLLPAAVFLVSAVLTGLALAYSRRRGLLDRPGRRRSHAEPTPRGGGIGILLAVLAASTALWGNGAIADEVFPGLAGGLALVGFAGWMEDHRPFDFRVRMAIQAIAAGWLVFFVGEVDSLELGGQTISLGPLSALLTFIALIWLTNLYNFLDGIDALAASEAVFAGSVMGAWLWHAGEPGIAALAFCVAASGLGFLPFNLPPARLFMGDVGSTSLGFAFGSIALVGAVSNALPPLVSLVILGPFVFDATFTLLSRLIKGERWYTAHREHAYQYLVRAGMSHGGATLIYFAVNVLVILPLVLLMGVAPASQGIVAVAATVLMLLTWILGRRYCASIENGTRS